MKMKEQDLRVLEEGNKMGQTNKIEGSYNEDETEYTDKEGIVYEFKDDQESWLGVCMKCDLTQLCLNKLGIDLKCNAGNRKDEGDGYFVKKIKEEK